MATVAAELAAIAFSRVNACHAGRQLLAGSE
jgi:hypothetical protein